MAVVGAEMEVSIDELITLLGAGGAVGLRKVAADALAAARGSGMSAARAVRVMRRAQGLTLRQLAESSGTSHSYLSQVERGDNVASPEWLRAALDAPADNLSTARA